VVSATDDTIEGIYDGGDTGWVHIGLDHRKRSLIIHARRHLKPRCTRTCMFEHLIPPR
jgi:hypothetical protein